MRKVLDWLIRFLAVYTGKSFGNHLSDIVLLQVGKSFFIHFDFILKLYFLIFLLLLTNLFKLKLYCYDFFFKKKLIKTRMKII